MQSRKRQMHSQEALTTMPAPESTSSSPEKSISMQQPSETPTLPQRQEPLLDHQKCSCKKLSTVTSSAQYRSRPPRALATTYRRSHQRALLVPCYRQFKRIVAQQKKQQEQQEIASKTTPVSNAPALLMRPICFRGATCYVCVVMPQCKRLPSSMVRVSRGIGVPTLTEAKAIIATVAVASSSSAKKHNATTTNDVTMTSACSVAADLSEMKL